MKTLIVFYSLEGSTKSIAQKIAAAIGAGLLELKTKKPYPAKGFAKYFFGGKDATFGISPALQNSFEGVFECEKIIFGFPIWAGTFAPPIRTFIKSVSIRQKKIALFATSMSTPPKKAFEKLKKLLPQNDFFAEEHFLFREQNLQEKIESFSKKLKA